MRGAALGHVRHVVVDEQVQLRHGRQPSGVRGAARIGAHRAGRRLRPATPASRRAQPHDVASASSSSSASARVSCAATALPSASISSTRTSKPRCTTRATCASRRAVAGSARERDVVRAHERVAEPR